EGHRGFYPTYPRGCPFLLKLLLSNQFEQAPEQGSDFRRQRPPTAQAPNFLAQSLTFQGVATVGMRRPTLRVIPGAVSPVAQLSRGASPGPQLDESVGPQRQVERRHVGPVVSHLLLACAMHLFDIVVVLFHGRAVSHGSQHRSGCRRGVRAEEG